MVEGTEALGSGVTSNKHRKDARAPSGRFYDSRTRDIRDTRDDRVSPLSENKVVLDFDGVGPEDAGYVHLHTSQFVKISDKL